MGGKAIRSIIIIEGSGYSVARHLWSGMALHTGRGTNRFVPGEAASRLR